MSRADRAVIVILTLALIVTPAATAWALYGPSYGLLAAGAVLATLYAIGRTFRLRRDSSRSHM